MRRGIMRARQQVRVPTRCPRSEHNTFAEDSNVANDSSVCTLRVSNLCSIGSAVGKPGGAGRGTSIWGLNCTNKVLSCKNAQINIIYRDFIIRREVYGKNS